MTVRENKNGSDADERNDCHPVVKGFSCRNCAYYICKVKCPFRPGRSYIPSWKLKKD
jgi:hypothetical protein